MGMKRYLVILLTILMANTTIAQNRWAIVVGISDYPTESGWGKINGANDLDLIVPMLQRNGFQATHIKTLTNKQATKNNIRTALIQVCKNLRKGDVVYFHFSGHGQLITDTNGDDCDRGCDLSLIPYDAKRKYDSDGSRGEKHIIDDELNE